MMMAMPSIAWPVWFSVVLAIETMSWIADRHRERAVLGQVQVLAGQRRNDHAQRLRQHDLAQHDAAAEAERVRRLPLAARHGLDAGADDLGDVGGGVDAPARAAVRSIPGLTEPPPWKLKPRSTGQFPGQGRAEHAQTRPAAPPATQRHRPDARGADRSPPRGAGDAAVHSVVAGRRRRRPERPGVRGCHASNGSLMPRLERNTASPSATPAAARAGPAAARTRTAVAAAPECRAASRHRAR